MEAADVWTTTSERMTSMKWMTFDTERKETYGAVEGKRVWDLPSLARKKGTDLAPTLLEGISKGDEFFDKTKELVRWGQENEVKDCLISLEDIIWKSPIPRPAKNIMCVGKNYRDHAIEMGSEADIPEHMMVFTKSPTAVTGHLALVDSHQEVTDQLDYEGELALVIGKKGKNIPQDKALDYVFGYTILNDITARDLQKRHKQFFIGKSLDTSCPMGPWIVHHSEIENPNELAIQTKVNGEIRQDSNTSHFIFPTEEIISTLSQGMTLEPGDIIATGTPAGVGKGFKPPKMLKSGDLIEITVEGIGELRNSVK